MHLEERLLRHKKRGVEFPFQRLPQVRVLRPELRPEVLTVLVDDVLKGEDRMQAHGFCSYATDWR